MNDDVKDTKPGFAACEAHGWSVTEYQGLVELRHTVQNANVNSWAQVLIAVTKEGVMFSTNGKAWFGKTGINELAMVVAEAQANL